MYADLKWRDIIANSKANSVAAEDPEVRDLKIQSVQCIHVNALLKAESVRTRYAVSRVTRRSYLQERCYMSAQLDCKHLKNLAGDVRFRKYKLRKEGFVL